MLVLLPVTGEARKPGVACGGSVSGMFCFDFEEQEFVFLSLRLLCCTLEIIGLSVY